MLYRAKELHSDPHLRSMREVSDYRIQARDGEIGHVEDFLIDEASWTIRYLLIDTVNWWPGKKVVLPPNWASNISWHESKVFLDLNRHQVKEAPEFRGMESLTRDYEEQLHHYYNRPGYWTEEHEIAGRR